MPPTGAATKVKDPEYRNWLKVGLALYYLKDGLHSFIQGEVDAMHQSLLQSLYQSSIVPRPKCSICKSEELKQNRKFRSPCPSNLCDAWLDKLLLLHINPKSNINSFENCNVNDWPFVPWECAKLYMPRGQPQTNNGPAMSDSQALLTLMANCKHFHTKLSSLKVIHKVSTLRNRVMHSGYMKLSDGSRKSFIQDIIHLLEDPVHLKSLKECNEAVDEINRVNNDSLDVSFNTDLEMKALSECVNDCRLEVGIFKENTEKTVGSLKEELINLNIRYDSFMKENKDKIARLSFGLKKQNVRCTAIKKNVDSLKRKTVISQSHQNRKLRKLGEEIQEVKTSISRKTDEVSTKNMESDISKLQHNLIQAYRSLRYVQVSPIFEKMRCYIDNICVDLVIEEKEDNSTTKVTSYKQIFLDERGSNFKRVYFRGKGGLGKTTFCKKVLHAWCNTHEGRRAPQNGYFQDEDVLQIFDLLFYLNLREISVEDNLIEVICRQCPFEEEPNRTTLGTMLSHNGNKVLFILDGLDELIVKTGFIENVLTRRVHPDCSFFVSTRPWKISQMELQKGPEIDLLLDLQGFTTRSAKIFAKNIFENCYKDGNAIKQFNKDIKHNKLATELIHVPLLLLFMAHVWYEQMTLPSKLHELYIIFLNLLANRMDEKYKKDADHRNTFTLCETHSPFPSKLSETSLVVNFGEGFLLSLCEVAHHFLLSSQKENSLVFEEKQLLNALGERGKEKLNLALDLGVLSVTDSLSYLVRKTSVSFIHKTVQEFFTAVCLIFNPEKFANFVSSIGDVNEVQQNENIIVFLVGLMPKHGNKVLQKVNEICSNDWETCWNGSNLLDYQQQLYAINEMYLRCKGETDGEDVFLDVSCLQLNTKLKTDLYLRPWNQSVLQFLNLSWEEDTDDDHETITVDLRRFTELKYLSLSDLNSKLYLPNTNSLTVLIIKNMKLPSSCDVLGRALLHYTKLPKLEVWFTDLHDCHLELSHMRDLTLLKLWGVTLTCNCWDILFKSLTMCHGLETLDLYRNNIPLSCHLDLSQFKVLSQLTLQFKDASNYCCDILDWHLTHCTRLKELSLYNAVGYGFMGPFMFERLAVERTGCLYAQVNTASDSTEQETLEQWNMHLKVCDLDQPAMTQLTRLLLEDVVLSSCCNDILVNTLMHCTQLKSLCLKDTDLQNCLLDLSNMTLLCELTLDKIRWSSSCCDELGRTLKQCTHLQTLTIKNTDLNNCELDLTNMTDLSKLELDNVEMSSSCCDVLGRTLTHCTKLTNLTLQNSHLYNCELDLSNMTTLSYLIMENVLLSKSASRVLEQSFDRLQSVKEDLCNYSIVCLVCWTVSSDKYVMDSNYNFVSVEYNDPYDYDYNSDSESDSDF
ncbi:hypothetical protein CHS0354_007138 [Potamilus streckersoni]|uniref:NACHT domain-containing protein n=1 Tax=Potamilus streckersoni TaxID=2493646 RepID=A0AAE0SMP1_9BIVA|nr:hypothetical protein CHS0354_007138 [Potamilus streckersoni]